MCFLITKKMIPGPGSQARIHNYNLTHASRSGPHWHASFCFRAMSLPARPHILNVLRTARLPIHLQLVLEEALLRGTKGNWALINDGAFQPAIVMGISGRPEELINIPAAREAGIQVIKRFSGGGTVVVDENTVFATLIFEGSALPHVDCFPQPIMRWTEGYYSRVFEGLHSDFRLRENDYVFGDVKFGGNAQSITGKRWLHHTSFLWDYKPSRMALLKHPRKTPEYRQGREHKQFITRLSHELRSAAASPEAARAQFVGRLAAAAYALPALEVRECSMAEAASVLASKPMCNTKIIDLANHLASAGN